MIRRTWWRQIGECVWVRSSDRGGDFRSGAGPIRRRVVGACPGEAGEWVGVVCLLEWADCRRMPGPVRENRRTTETNRVAKSEPIEVEATVSQALPNAMFKLKLDGSDREILGIVSGKMRKHFIRILPGDRVKVELSPYDLTRGRIVFRQK